MMRRSTAAMVAGLMAAWMGFLWAFTHFGKQAGYDKDIILLLVVFMSMLAGFAIAGFIAYRDFDY